MDFSSKKILKSVWSIFLLSGSAMFINEYNNASPTIKGKTEYQAMYVFAIFTLIGSLLCMMDLFFIKDAKYPTYLGYVRNLCLFFALIFIFMITGYGPAIINDMGGADFRSIFGLTLIGYFGIIANESCNFDLMNFYPKIFDTLTKSASKGASSYSVM
jgi:hypothetical protein